MAINLKQHLKTAVVVGMTAVNGTVAYTLFSWASEEIPSFNDTHYKTKANADCVIDQSYWAIGIKAEQNIGDINIAVDGDTVADCVADAEDAYYQEKNNNRIGNYIMGSLGVAGALCGVLAIATRVPTPKKPAEGPDDDNDGQKQTPPSLDPS